MADDVDDDAVCDNGIEFCDESDEGKLELAPGRRLLVLLRLHCLQYGLQLLNRVSNFHMGANVGKLLAVIVYSVHHPFITCHLQLSSNTWYA